MPRLLVYTNNRNPVLSFLKSLKWGTSFGRQSNEKDFKRFSLCFWPPKVIIYRFSYYFICDPWD